MQNRVFVTVLDAKFRKLEGETRFVSLKVLEILKRKKIFLEVYLVSEDSIRRLNRDYRGSDKPTNVLSFGEVSKSVFKEPENDLGKGFRGIGEIYLCPSYIARFKEDFRLMLTHGLLHLLGYDHERRSDRIRMQNLEKRICRKILSLV
ncbi:MAG: putative rRNA maturation factor [Parcubacteria group bacterium Gr01-1014_20]|nr:MAG: putative rRNA maturation factor [Parcubacteria group bacterium Gr01-1014_20]